MPEARDDILRFEDFQLSPAHRKLTGASGEITLRAKSLDVLIHLAKSAGRVVSKTELLDAIWPDVTVSDESLERCISDIRIALSDHDRKIVKTVARRGYILAVKVEKLADVPEAPKLTWRSKTLAIMTLAALAVVAALYTLWPQAETPKLLAILPVTNTSGQAEDDYFADGLTEDISAALTRLKSIGVVASGSTAKFKGSAENAKTIGERLSATFLLTGSLRKEPHNIELSLQLVNAETGAQIWSDRYDGSPDGFVSAKADLVRTIATTLDAQITKAELDRIAHKSPTNLSSYDLILQGNALLRNIHLENRGEDIAAARSRYEAAANAEPRSSQAAEGLANSYLMAWLEPSPGHDLNGEFQAPNILKWAGDYARQAVELDEASATARATLGWVLFWQSGPAEALALFDRANALDPGRADWRYGLLLSHGGRAKEAEAYMKRIMKIDPLHPPRYQYLLGKSYFFQGRFAEAMPLIKQAATEMPTHRPSHVLLAAVLSELNFREELPHAVADIFKLDPQFSIEGWIKYTRYSDEGYKALLRRALKSAGLPS